MPSELDLGAVVVSGVAPNAELRFVKFSTSAVNFNVEIEFDCADSVSESPTKLVAINLKV